MPKAAAKNLTSTKAKAPAKTTKAIAKKDKQVKVIKKTTKKPASKKASTKSTPKKVGKKK